MPLRAELRPRGPYSLRVSGRLASDATRVVADGTYRATVRVGDGLERVHAVQRADGTIVVAAESDAGVEHVRFVLGIDDDHSEFLRRFARDPLLGETLRQIRGLRPMRTATVAQALLRAVAGQLIQASRARQIERTIVRAATPELGGLHAAPTGAELGRFSPAQLGRLGLGARRAACLIRLCRSLELETLKAQPSGAVAARLQRERGLGPWSVGVVCLEGLGRYEHGLARDLGLAKLASALWGRWAEPEEADVLLEPYGEWAGLASVYLLAGYARGFVPLSRAAA
jgi:3-methyladenine DNA glycosylase/8-oxoguanine DNA glycosylase